MTRTDLPMPGTRIPRPGRGCDCANCAFWAGPDGTGGAATVEPLCSGTNSDCSYCGCSRAEADAPAGACGTCPVRCPSRDNVGAWMADAGGTLTFDDIELGNALPPGIPAYTPQVDGTGIAELDTHLDWPAYAVGLRRVFSPHSHRIYPRWHNGRARELLGLRTKQLAVLSGYGEDPLVEAFWTRRRRDGLIERIAAQGWDVVLSCNYSVYGNWPRLEQLLNMRRSLILAQEFTDAGMAVVPNLYWFRLEDLLRWGEWITDTSPPAIAVNAQTMRGAQDWQSWLLPGLHWLAAQTPPDLPVFITGLSRPDRIGVALDLFGTRLRLLNQTPQAYALHGEVMGPQGRRRVHASTPDAFRAGVRYFSGLLSQHPEQPV